MVIYYITEKEAYKRHFERGDVLRIKNVIYECKECGAKTNKIILGGWPGYGLRWICPGDIFKCKNPRKKLSKALEDIEGVNERYIIKKFTPSSRPSL